MHLDSPNDRTGNPQRDDAGGGERPSGGTPPAAAAADMAGPVTRHVRITGPKDFHYLACGLDSLDLSLNVQWGECAEAMFEELEQKKIEAAGHDGALWRSTALGLAMVRPSGRPPLYRYRFVVPDLEFFVAKQFEPKKAPNVQVSISSRLLWDVGARIAAANAIELIKQLGGQVTRSWPSRCDLCVDFLMDESIAFDFIRQTRVCRSSKIRPYLDGDRMETCYLGSPGAPVQCRIYDKGLEIMVDGVKFWFAEVWGIDSVSDVWRTEFQLRREFLKEFKIESVDGLLDNASALWRYLTQEWLALRLPDSTNTARRTVHPWWRAVQDCEFLIGPESNAKRSLQTSDVAEVDWYVSHVAGCLCGFAARLGVTTVEATWQRFRNEFRQYWECHDWETEYAKRRLRLGRHPDAAPHVAQGGCDVPI